MEKQKRPAYETVIVALVVGLSLVLGIGLYSGRARIQKSNLLIQELAMLRSSVTVYKMLNGKNPESLEELAASTYKVDSMPRPYIDRLPRSQNGGVVDPFGNPYRYDIKSGWVCSGTPEFARW
ncbi:MAG: type II secretion system protein GspG [Pseudomonadota bacterium]